MSDREFWLSQHPKQLAENDARAEGAPPVPAVLEQAREEEKKIRELVDVLRGLRKTDDLVQLAKDGYDAITALRDELARLSRENAEKKQELAVAYGSGKSSDEREWFSALDRERERAEAAEADAKRCGAHWVATYAELHKERARVADLEKVAAAADDLSYEIEHSVGAPEAVPARVWSARVVYERVRATLAAALVGEQAAESDRNEWGGFDYGGPVVARSSESDDTREGLPPLDTEGVLWVAALDRVPIEERIEWVRKQTEHVARINQERAAGVLPADEPERETR